jgi:putative transcriptional regulator
MTQKRKLFDELMDGVEAMQAQREGKITLPSYQKNTASLPQLTPIQIREVRENLHLPLSVFASLLHVAPHTMENWENGKSYPNHQALALILLVHKYPDTLERLAALD